MSGPSDAAVVASIRQLIAQLNAELAEAAKRGLKVDLSQQALMAFDEPAPQVILTVEIFKVM